MTFNELAVEISKREGKRLQVNIANIKEILSCIVAIDAEAIVFTDSAVRVLSDLSAKLYVKKQLGLDKKKPKAKKKKK